MRQHPGPGTELLTLDARRLSPSASVRAATGHPPASKRERPALRRQEARCQIPIHARAPRSSSDRPTSWCSRPSSAPLATKPHHRPAVPVWAILEHLALRPRSATARHVRARLEALHAAGSLDCVRRHGVTTWALTSSGRRRVRRAVRGGELPPLPESPQHRAWRNARVAAAQELERFRTRAARARRAGRGAAGRRAPRRTPTPGSSSPTSCSGPAGAWPRRATACTSGPSPTIPARTSTSTSSRPTGDSRPRSAS